MRFTRSFPFFPALILAGGLSGCSLAHDFGEFTFGDAGSRDDGGAVDAGLDAPALDGGADTGGGDDTGVDAPSPMDGGAADTGPDATAPPCEMEILDPGFQTADTWTVSGGAQIAPTAPGALDDGIAVLSGALQCIGAAVSQTTCVPTFAEAGRLQLQAYVRMPDIFDMRPVPSVSIGGRPAQTLVAFPSGTFRQEAVCLGAAGYGGDIEFELTARERFPGAGCDTTVALAYDNVTLSPVGPEVCPAPGFVHNGDASETYGWRDTSPSGSFEIRLDGGSRVLYFHGAVGVCQTARAVGLVSPPLPTTLPRAALQFRMRGVGNAVFNVNLRGPTPQSAQFNPSANYETHTICIDPDNLGLTFEMELELTGPNTCANAQLREFYVDDFVFVSDASC